MTLATKEWVTSLIKKVINKDFLRNIPTAGKPKIANTIYVNGRPQFQTGTITLYVNSATGNDDTGDGTKENPLASLNGARGRLPHSDFDGEIRLYVSGNFTTTQYFGNFGARQITLYMVDNPTFYKLNFYRIPYMHMQGDFTINYTNKESIQYGSALDINAANVFYQSVSKGISITGITTSNTRGVYLSCGAHFSTAYDPAINIITIKNCWQGVLAEFLGEIYAGKFVGSGNTAGLVAGCGGHVFYYTQSGMATSTYANGKIN